MINNEETKIPKTIENTIRNTDINPTTLILIKDNKVIPRALPDKTPVIPGSTRLFLVILCNTKPDIDKEIPDIKTAKVWDNLMCIMFFSTSSPPESIKFKKLIPELPISSETKNAKRSSINDMMYVKSFLEALFFFI